MTKTTVEVAWGQTPAGRAEKGLAKSEVAEGEWCGVVPQGTVASDLISNITFSALQVKIINSPCFRVFL